MTDATTAAPVTLETLLAASRETTLERLRALPLEHLESLARTQDTLLRHFTTERQEVWAAMQGLIRAELERRRGIA